MNETLFSRANAAGRRCSTPHISPNNFALIAKTCAFTSIKFPLLEILFTSFSHHSFFQIRINFKNMTTF